MDWFPSYNIYIYIFIFICLYTDFGFIRLYNGNRIDGNLWMFLFCGNLWRIYGFVLFGFCSARIDIYIYSSNGLCCFRCFVLWYLFGNVWKIMRYNMTQLTGWMIIYGIQWDTLGYGIWLHDAKEHEGFDLCRMMLMVWFCFLFGVVDG